MTSAELLAFFKLQAARPSTDELLTDATIYLMLTRGQSRVNAELAVHVPQALYGAPELMTTSDSGVTYTVGTDCIGGLEVYPTLRSDPLRPGTFFDAGADYTVEGPRTIRMPGSRPRTFSGGPYARYVKQTGTLDGSTQPTLSPAAVHPAIAYEALIEYAGIAGVVADPNVWVGLRDRLLWGDYRTGAVGIIPALQQQVRVRGRSNGQWWSVFV